MFYWFLLVWSYSRCNVRYIAHNTPTFIFKQKYILSINSVIESFELFLSCFSFLWPSKYLVVKYGWIARRHESVYQGTQNVCFVCFNLKEWLINSKKKKKWYRCNVFNRIIQWVMMRNWKQILSRAHYNWLSYKCNSRLTQ